MLCLGPEQIDSVQGNAPLDIDQLLPLNTQSLHICQLQNAQVEQSIVKIEYQSGGSSGRHVLLLSKLYKGPHIESIFHKVATLCYQQVPVIGITSLCINLAVASETTAEDIPMSAPSGFTIASMDGLRQLIPSPPAIMQKRLLAQLDEHCLDLIEQAALLVVGHFAAGSSIELINLRQPALTVIDKQHLRLQWPDSSTAAFPDDSSNAVPCSFYFILPGIGFGLRLNGSGQLQVQGRQRFLHVRIRVAFLHCSRAMLRAGFWQPDMAQSARQHSRPNEHGQCLSAKAMEFIQQAPYLLLLTQNASGNTDLSPRGDPAGFVQILNTTQLFVPERPGNKVASSLGNILSQAKVALLLIIPGSTQVLQVTGLASLSQNPAWLTPCTIQGKLPKLGLLLEVTGYQLRSSIELGEVNLWNSDHFIADSAAPSFAKMLAEHMNGTGLLGKLTTPLVGRVVKRDVDNLY